MQGRYFASRRIQAHPWDGVTNYQVEETEEEKAKKLKQWEKFLEEDGAAEDKELGTGQTATSRNRATCAYTMVFLFYTSTPLKSCLCLLVCT